MLAVLAASKPSNRKMISPAYMFPNSRRLCDNGLETYSTALKSRLNSNNSGFDPKGEQNNSWIQPPSPLTLMLYMIISPNTDRASAIVVLDALLSTNPYPSRTACGCFDT